MTVGVVGLGLIGGSLAKAIKDRTDHKVLGFDIVDTVVYKAKLIKAVDGELTNNNLADCDLIIVALYPAASVSYVKENASIFKKGTVVLDCGGVKREVCAELEELAKNSDFYFVGGHPMAGIEFSGFEYSKKNLFEKASMIVTPYSGTPIEVMEMLKKLFLTIGFNNFQITTPDDHDRMIAFTSQLAHIVSNAYVKGPAALRHKGFSAGSYKDMTRVAKLNEVMWTELFLDNADYLSQELEELIKRLQEYSEVIKKADAEKLRAMLKEGSDIKVFLNDE